MELQKPRDLDLDLGAGHMAYRRASLIDLYLQTNFHSNRKSAVMSMYTGTKTVVRTVYGNSSGFEVKVGMHQGSALSPLLFVIVVEAISREFRVALPRELLGQVENVRSQCRRLQNGHVVYVADVLVVIQYNALAVASGYTRSVVV